MLLEILRVGGTFLILAGVVAFWYLIISRLGSF
jgi:hypothetical protein